VIYLSYRLDPGNLLYRCRQSGLRNPLDELPQEWTGCSLGHLGIVYSIVFPPDGVVMIRGSEDGDVRIWDMKECLQEIKCKHSSCRLSRIHKADGDMLASAGDGTIKLWDVSNSRCAGILTEDSRVVELVAFSPDGHTCLHGRFSPDGQMLASGTWGNQIHLWDLNTRQYIARLSLNSNVHSIVYVFTRWQMHCLRQ
jgi:WD40 repeat protein